MKMAMITYNEAIEPEVMEALENSSLKNYTKITATYGKGETSGTHLGDDIWPGRNNVLFVAGGEAEVRQLLSYIKELRKTLGKEGIKAFVLPVEEVT